MDLNGDEKSLCNCSKETDKARYNQIQQWQHPINIAFRRESLVIQECSEKDFAEMRLGNEFL